MIQPDYNGPTTPVSKAILWNQWKDDIKRICRNYKWKKKKEYMSHFFTDWVDHWFSCKCISRNKHVSIYFQSNLLISHFLILRCCVNLDFVLVGVHWYARLCKHSHKYRLRWSKVPDEYTVYKLIYLETDPTFQFFWCLDYALIIFLPIDLSFVYLSPPCYQEFLPLVQCLTARFGNETINTAKTIWYNVFPTLNKLNTWTFLGFLVTGAASTVLL